MKMTPSLSIPSVVIPRLDRGIQFNPYFWTPWSSHGVTLFIRGIRSILLMTITTMQPVWGSTHNMSYKSLKSEMEKCQASISVGAAQTPSPATASDSATSRDRTSQNSLPGPEMGGILPEEVWDLINAEVESLKANIQKNMAKFNGDHLLSHRLNSEK